MRFSLFASTAFALVLSAASALAQPADPSSLPPPPPLPPAPPAPMVTAPAPPSSAAISSPFVTVAPPPPAPASPPTSPRIEDRLVRIEVPAIGRQGALELFVPARGHDADDDESWHKLCESPCVVSVPVGARLRVNGDFRESAAFRAPDRASARLAVDPARSGVRALGIGLAAVGGAFALGGGYLYTQVEPYRPSDDNRNRVTQGDALGVGLFGLAVLGAGVGLASWHWRTRVTIDGGAQPGVPLAKGVWWTGSAIAF